MLLHSSLFTFLLFICTSQSPLHFYHLSYIYLFISYIIYTYFFCRPHKSLLDKEKAPFYAKLLSIRVVLVCITLLTVIIMAIGLIILSVQAQNSIVVTLSEQGTYTSSLVSFFPLFYSPLSSFTFISHLSLLPSPFSPLPLLFVYYFFLLVTKQVEKQIIKESGTLFQWADTQLQICMFLFFFLLFSFFLFFFFLLFLFLPPSLIMFIRSARLMFQLEPNMTDPPPGENPFRRFPEIAEYLWTIVRSVSYIYPFNPFSSLSLLPPPSFSSLFLISTK